MLVYLLCFITRGVIKFWILSKVNCMKYRTIYITYDIYLKFLLIQSFLFKMLWLIPTGTPLHEDRLYCHGFIWILKFHTFQLIFKCITWVSVLFRYFINLILTCDHCWFCPFCKTSKWLHVEFRLEVDIVSCADQLDNIPENLMQLDCSVSNRRLL